MKGEKYKILAGMLALKKFTVKDLVRYTDVEEATVHSNIGRLGHLLKQADLVSSHRPGGREKIYELEKTRVPEIESELGNLFESLKIVQPKPKGDKEPPTPIGLETAEDAIGNQLSEIPPEKREQILEIAKIDVSGAWAEIEELALSHGDCTAIADMRVRAAAVEKRISLLELVTKLHAVRAKLKERIPADVEYEIPALEPPNELETPWILYEVGKAIQFLEKIADLAIDQPATTTVLPAEQKGPTKPTSEHFGEAQKAIDMALQCKIMPRRQQLLTEAGVQMRLAANAEDDAYATENLKAHLACERARIGFAQGLYEQAHLEFSRLRQIFLQNDDREAAQQANEYASAAEVCGAMAISHYIPDPAAPLKIATQALSADLEALFSPTRAALLDVLEYSYRVITQLQHSYTCLPGDHENEHKIGTLDIFFNRLDSALGQSGSTGLRAGPWNRAGLQKRTIQGPMKTYLGPAEELLRTFV